GIASSVAAAETRVNDGDVLLAGDQSRETGAEHNSAVAATAPATLCFFTIISRTLKDRVTSRTAFSSSRIACPGHPRTSFVAQLLRDYRRCTQHSRPRRSPRQRSRPLSPSPVNGIRVVGSPPSNLALRIRVGNIGYGTGRRRPDARPDRKHHGR